MNWFGRSPDIIINISSQDAHELTGIWAEKYLNSKQKLPFDRVITMGIGAAAFIKLGMNVLNAKYVKPKFRPQFLRIKAGIKFASYGLLTGHLFKNGYSKTALFVAAFGLLDSATTLSMLDLSPKLRAFIKNLEREIAREDIETSEDEESEDEDDEGDTKSSVKIRSVKIDENFLNLCKMREKHEIDPFVIPFDLVRRRLSQLELIMLRKDGNGRNLCKEYLNLFGGKSFSFSKIELTTLFAMVVAPSWGSSIIKEPMIENTEGINPGLYRERENILKLLAPQLEWYKNFNVSAVHEIGISYFRKKGELESTWNKLPVEIVFHIFSYVIPSLNTKMVMQDTKTVMEHCDDIAQWKETGQHDERPPSPQILIAWRELAALFFTKTITVKTREKKEEEDLPCATIRIGSLEFLDEGLDLEKISWFLGNDAERRLYAWRPLFINRTHLTCWWRKFSSPSINYVVVKDEKGVFYTRDRRSYLRYKEVKDFVYVARKPKKSEQISNEKTEEGEEIRGEQIAKERTEEDEMTVQLSIVNEHNSDNVKIIKLEKELYNALVWLAGENSTVKLHIDTDYQKHKMCFL